MEGRLITNTELSPKAPTTLADLKLRMAEHIIAQYNPDKADVWSILAETKVGAWRKWALLKKLERVFSVA